MELLVIDLYFQPSILVFEQFEKSELFHYLPPSIILMYSQQFFIIVNLRIIDSIDPLSLRQPSAIFSTSRRPSGAASASSSVYSALATSWRGQWVVASCPGPGGGSGGGGNSSRTPPPPPPIRCHPPTHVTRSCSIPPPEQLSARSPYETTIQERVEWSFSVLVKVFENKTKNSMFYAMLLG